MIYESTRNRKTKVSASEAIVKGISDEGGLFVPDSLPYYKKETISKMVKADYMGIAKIILSDFLSDFTEEEIDDSLNNAYLKGNFENDSPAPVYMNLKNNEIFILELFHGPTCAFKDIALQLLPQLLTKSLRKTCPDKKAVILVATSGDTGKAALEGFKNVENTIAMVFYPQNGVSQMQKLQMVTQEGTNVKVCAVKGNFDDIQTEIKRIFTDEKLILKLKEKSMIFSSANSINWGRLLPQIVYYFSAYCNLLKHDKIKPGEKVNFVVPTGNFGNILAGFYAKEMGLPINKLICASNSNCVLTDFIKTGTYNKNREFYLTNSPSMDILVSSNLERLIYHLYNKDSEKVASLMNNLKNQGFYSVDKGVKEKMSELFYGAYCDCEETEKTIKTVFKEHNYLCDTHTAVAFNVYKQYKDETKDKTKTIILATASPYKFAPSVFKSLFVDDFDKDKMDENEIIRIISDKTNTIVPVPISSVRKKQIRFLETCAIPDISDYVINNLYNI